MGQNVNERLDLLRKNAAARWSIAEKDCHVGHLAYQAMLQEPDLVNQIDAAIDKNETNSSVGARSAQLANAMSNYGLKTGDRVIVMGNNHLDLCIPFYACHYNGYSVCAIDPSGAGDVIKLWKYVEPNMIFCQKSCVEKVKEAFEVNKEKCEVVVFDDEEADLKAFIKKHNGTEVDFRPAMFDPAEITGWLILTSGTTGLPKVSIIPFKNVLTAVVRWWTPVKPKIERVWTMATLQWMSGLLFFISGPLIPFIRLQSSGPPTPPAFVGLINKYKPCATAWTPYILGGFIEAAAKVCDLSSFKYIIIGGSAIGKELLEKFKKVCKAEVKLVYGMTEMLVPVFDFDENTPFGASGTPIHDKYEYKLVDDSGKILSNPRETGELWIKSDEFFKGYRNNPEETSPILKGDGWFATGDMFYRDDRDYYFFAERKRLILKHYGFQISPLQMEEVLKKHPSVVEACVVNIPMVEYTELPVAAILKKDAANVEFEELFELLDKNVAVGRKLSVGFFFIDAFPVTPSGKLHRARVKEMAATFTWKIIDRKIVEDSNVNKENGHNEDAPKTNSEVKSESKGDQKNNKSSCCVLL